MNRKPSKVSWGPELQAVNQAFAALEEELRCEIALQENRSVQLAAASAQLKEREQELEQLLNSALQDRSDLAQQAVAAGAQIKQLEASLDAMTQQLAERRADLEASQANLARQQHLRDELQAQLDSASQSLLRLEEEAKVGRLNAAQAALDGQRAADLAVQSRQVQEALERQLKSLLESLQFERMALLAAQKAHDERDRQCARQDTHIAELRTRLSDESARADHALERLSQLRRAADETVDALKRDSRQLRAEVALQQQNSRADALARESQLHEHWRRQEAATAIEHAQAQARLRDRVAELQASLAEQEQQLRAERHASSATMAAFANWHYAALASHDERHEMRLRAQLLEHDRAQAGIMASLQRRHEEAAAAARSLQEQVCQLEQRLLPLPTSAAPEPVEASAEQVAPPAQSNEKADSAIRATALLQAELGALRTDLDHERSHRASLVQELQALAAAAAQQAANRAPEPAPAQEALPPPTLLSRDASAPELEETSAMSDNLSLNQLLALHDESFVRAAYQVVLSRPAENSGLQEHLDQLRSGVSKESIVFALAQSGEAQRLGTSHSLVAELQQRARLPQNSLLTRALRRLLGLSLQGTSERLNASENRLGSQIADLAQAQQRSEANAAARARQLLKIEGAVNQAHWQQDQRQQNFANQMAESLAQISERIEVHNQRLLGLSDRVAHADQRLANVESALAHMAQHAADSMARLCQDSATTLATLRQSSDAVLAQTTQAMNLTREEGRLTRSVVSTEGSHSLAAHTPAGPAGLEPVQSLDIQALARVREMLLPRGMVA